MVRKWPGLERWESRKTSYSEGLNSHPVPRILGAGAARGLLTALLGSRRTGVKTEIELEDCHSVSPRAVRPAKFSPGKEVLPHKASCSLGASRTLGCVGLSGSGRPQHLTVGLKGLWFDLKKKLRVGSSKTSRL